MKTTRQEMMELLLQGEPLGARELSQALHITEREVYTHLEHVARTVQSAGRKLSLVPARCLDCGFVFKARKKMSPPGNCPGCKGSHLQRPLYTVR